jgi:Plavaka transposase
MSSKWVAKQAVYIPLVSKFLQTDFVHTQDEISWDLSTHGAMLVGIVVGSDKTVASVATGHQEFHPVYVGPGNVDNPTWQAHGIRFLPCAFLLIPKGIFLNFSSIC